MSQTLSRNQSLKDGLNVQEFNTVTHREHSGKGLLDSWSTLGTEKTPRAAANAETHFKEPHMEVDEETQACLNNFVQPLPPPTAKSFVRKCNNTKFSLENNDQN